MQAFPQTLAVERIPPDDNRLEVAHEGDDIKPRPADRAEEGMAFDARIGMEGDKAPVRCAAW